MIIGSISILFYCENEKELFKHEYSSLEMFRKLVLEESIKGFPLRTKTIVDSVFYKTKYEILDTLSEENPRLMYIRLNPELPKYIARALIEKYSVNYMTIGEFFLARPDLLKELQSDTLILSFPKHLPDQMILGYSKYLSEKSGMFLGGSVWIFKYGFLYESGII
jgi:hypothetical protein